MTTEVSKYIPKVKERFPYLKDDEIEAILNFGFRTIFALVKLNADVFLKNSSWSVHFGKRHLTKDDIHKYMCWKTRVKSRLVDKYAGKPFDGVYYFGLSEEDFQKFRKSRKHKYTFTNIYLHKLKEEAFLMCYKHFFKIYYPIDCGYIVHKDKLTTRGYKYFAYRNDEYKIIEFDENKTNAN